MVTPTKLLQGETTVQTGMYSGPWNSITEPGCYVFQETGLLARVAEESLAAGHSPLVSITATKPLFVTRISPDPYIPIGKARQLAADAGLFVNF